LKPALHASFFDVNGRSRREIEVPRRAAGARPHDRQAVDGAGEQFVEGGVRCGGLRLVPDVQVDRVLVIPVDQA
jgi:hypothetical protein